MKNTEKEVVVIPPKLRLSLIRKFVADERKMRFWVFRQNPAKQRDKCKEAEDCLAHIDKLTEELNRVVE